MEEQILKQNYSNGDNDKKERSDLKPEEKIELIEEKKELLLANKCEGTQLVLISSKSKLMSIAIIIALLNPILSGLILAIWMLFEPNLKREGKIVLAISIIWGLIILYLIYLRKFNLFFG